MSVTHALDPEESELVSAALDSLLADPERRRQLARWFANWIEARAKLVDKPGLCDSRYLLAKYAPWHDLASREDGHGWHQVIGEVDRMLLAMVERIRVMAKPDVPRKRWKK